MTLNFCDMAHKNSCHIALITMQYSGAACWLPNMNYNGGMFHDCHNVFNDLLGAC